MYRNLISEITEIRTNRLESYVSKYFETHLEDKMDVLKTFEKYGLVLKIEPCMWALIVALDGMCFDELIIDEYTNYEVMKDLRFIIATEKLRKFLSKECIIRIGLSKEWKLIYLFKRYTILETILYADGKNSEEIVSCFKRIVQTQTYNGKPIFENINLTHIDEEMKLLECIFKVRHKLNFPATLVFYALHDLNFVKALLDLDKIDIVWLEKDIETILKENKVKAQYLKVPGLFFHIINDIDEKVLDDNFSCDDIFRIIKSKNYFSCKTNNFGSLISYIYVKYRNRFDEFEKILLDYIEKDEFYVEYSTITYLILLEFRLRNFREYNTFKNKVLDLPVILGLFEEFKTGRSNFPAGLKIVLRKYNIKFDYIVNRLLPMIDDEDEDEIAAFEAFKNVLK